MRCMQGWVAMIRRKEFTAIPCSEYRIISRLLIRVLNSIRSCSQYVLIGEAFRNKGKLNGMYTI